MSKLEKATDIIIGEATKTLLERDEEISFDYLLQFISEKHDSLQDDSQKHAFRQALSEIQKYATLATHRTVTDDEHPGQALNNTHPGASNTSH